jgi:glutamine amidotransferase
LSARAAVQIVNYGVGNLGSLVNAITFLGAEVLVLDAPDQLRTGTHVLLPGVGAFAPAAEALAAHGWPDALSQAREAGAPIIGVCLGMQLLFETSDEAPGAAGLCWLPGSAKALRPAPDSPVPHMGWNSARVVRESAVAGTVDDCADFYFAHSFAVPGNCPDVIATTTTGSHEFASIVGRDNVLGVQFHPERSQSSGLALLQRFIEWDSC